MAAEPEFMTMGKSFVGFYYPEFSKDRSATSQLANVYTEQVNGYAGFCLIVPTLWRPSGVFNLPLGASVSRKLDGI